LFLLDSFNGDISRKKGARTIDEATTNGHAIIPTNVPIFGLNKLSPEYHIHSTDTTNGPNACPLCGSDSCEDIFNSFDNFCSTIKIDSAVKTRTLKKSIEPKLVTNDFYKSDVDNYNNKKETMRSRKMHKTFVETVSENVIEIGFSNNKSVKLNSDPTEVALNFDLMRQLPNYNLSFLYYPNQLRTAINSYDISQIEHLTRINYDNNCLIQVLLPSVDYTRHGASQIDKFFALYLLAHPDLVADVMDIKTCKRPDSWYVKCELR